MSDEGGGEPEERGQGVRPATTTTAGTPTTITTTATAAAAAAAAGRARAEDALRESEERLRIAIDAAEMATWVWDLTSDQVAWSERHFALFGMPPTDGLQTSEAFFERVHPDDRTWVGERLRRAVETDSTFEAEFRAVRQDNGEVRWMAGYGRVVRAAAGAAAGEGGGPTRMAGVMCDVTARRRAVERLRESQERLRRANDECEQRVSGRTRELAAANASLRDEVRERQAGEARIKALLGRLVSVQEEDRRRIARELHDTLGQQLAALRWSVEQLRARAGAGGGAREEAERTRLIFERLNADVDFLAWELRPAALDTLGLDAALEDFVREWGEHFGVRAEYRGTGPGAARFSPAVETNLYRILQEALQNVRKHAGATRVSVLLERREGGGGGGAVLIVEDDGRGYDAAAEVAADTSKGMGVVNMRERAALAGGEFEIESAPGAGATVYVRVPAGGPDGGGGD